MSETLIMPDLLQKELEFFESKRLEWLMHYEGKYSLIVGSEVAGFYDSAESAYNEGVRRWGKVPFLVKQVLREDPVEQAPALVCGLLHANF